MHRSISLPACPGARHWRRLAAAAIALTAVAGAMAVVPGTLTRPARADDVTASLDSLRTGWDSSEPGLRPAVLRSGRFRRLFATRVDGQVYAQPIVAGRMVIAATENDWVYGLDAVTGQVIWHRRLGRPFPQRLDHCGDLAPHVGITSTPVYDPQTGAVYLVAETAGASPRHPAFSLIGVAAQTGRVTERVRIAGVAGNDHRLRFRAFHELQRPGLLLLDGWVYAGFGSHCDQLPYDGYLAGINVASHAVRLWSDEAGLTSGQAGIWQSGSGLMSDGPHRIFLATGNGVSPPPGRGTSPPGQLAESVVRLAVRPGGALVARDFFSPSNAPVLDAGDTDFGSGGPTGLPFGAAHYPRLLAEAGKDGRLFLLDRGHLGGRHRHRNAVAGMAGPFGPQYGHPAAFGDTPVVTARNSRRAHDYLYYAGQDDALRVLRFQVRPSGRPVLSDVASSSFTFAFSSGSPVVTSAGRNLSSAVVWVIRSAGKSGARGTLYAFRAVPRAGCRRPCQLRAIWSAPLGRASKFSIPAISGGRVYVGTRDGRVLGFGTAGHGPARGLAPVAFAPTRVGATSSHQVTITAPARVTVSRITASTTAGPGPFRVRAVTAQAAGLHAPESPQFPVTLNAGDRLRVLVAFSPSAPGGATGILRVAASWPGQRAVTVPLTGEGVRTGLYASARALSFALVPSGQAPRGVPVGIAVPRIVDITNSGTGVQTVTSVRRPAGPFTVTGLPAVGARLQPGQSVPVQVRFLPRHAGRAAGSLTIAGSSGTAATVRLAGTGVPARSRLRVTPARLDFGTVRRGRQVTAVITVGNAGNQPATLTAATGPDAPFAVRYRVPAGLPLNPGQDLQIPVTFRPRSRGLAAGRYRLTWTSGSGRHTLVVLLAGHAR